MIESNRNAFYAVRPELVLNAAQHFDVRASILDGGARSLYNKAVALNSGKASGRWGKHQRAVIKQFCEYTITTGSDALLPWQELVEDEMNYDGREGISARTGNRPLTTVQRVGININALKQARIDQSLELSELASRSGLPLRFLEAIEDGQWSEVATSTAECIANVLRMHPESLFIYSKSGETDDKSNEEPAADSSDQKIPIEKFKSYSLTAIACGLTAILALCVVTWLLVSSKWLSASVLEDFTSSQWRMSVELMNHNIPIPEDTITLWQNGGYIQLRQNGVIAFNWIDPSALVELPQPDVSWGMQNNQVTLKLDTIIYSFDIGENREKLVTLDSTRSFEMTLQIISK